VRQRTSDEPASNIWEVVLEEVYVANTFSGDLCVFSKTGDDVRIFLPQSHYEKYLSINILEWRSIAASYHTPNDLDLYDEVVNAAWQGVGIQNSIVRQSAKKLRTRIGTYHPRIWRGTFDPKRLHCYNAVDARSVYGSEYIRTNIAASSLFDQMQDLFRSVEPSAANMQTYGNRIRELLILTCTEVEAGWRAVLDKNSPAPKGRYTTSDYIKVNEPLRLSDWEVALRDYPDIGTFIPFKDWTAPETTRSIPWYEAYNAVKHNREAQFSQASFGNILNAAAAVHILQAAQWGPEMYHRFFGTNSSPFWTVRHPEYDLGDLYVPTIDGKAELSAAYYFAAT
jgi:hypothetical protein